MEEVEKQPDPRLRYGLVHPEARGNEEKELPKPPEKNFLSSLLLNGLCMNLSRKQLPEEDIRHLL